MKLPDLGRLAVLDERLREVPSDRYGEAEATLREALSVTPPGLAHFALQHLGKTPLDRGRHAEAAEWLESALALRQEAGDEALIRSTEQALAAARSARGG